MSPAPNASNDRRRRPPATARELLEQLPAAVLVARLPVPLFALDRAGVLVVVNPALAELVDVHPDELVGRHIVHLIKQIDPTREPAPQVRALARQVVTLTGGAVDRYARLSPSILLRDDEDFTIAVLDDVTDEHWHTRPPGRAGRR